MRYLLNLSLLLLFGFAAFSQGPLITEIHYDNNYDQYDPFGIDSIEHVEIYLPDPQPADLTSFQIITYNQIPGDTTMADVGYTRDLEDTLRTWKTPNGKYYVIEFVDSTFFGFPAAGINDGPHGVALVELGSPNIVHQFWRYETCEDFTAINGSAVGAISNPITTDFSRACGSSGVDLVQMNSAMATNRSIQQNGFGDWDAMEPISSRQAPLENNDNVPVEMMFFRVNLDKDYTFLSWATAQEFDNDYFIIYHSTDGKNFEEIGKVDGKGNYTGESRYDFRHYTQENGRHYYQIRQVDYNGQYEDFEIRSVLIDNQKDIIATPTATSANFKLTNIEQGTMITIFDFQGREVIKQRYEGAINVSDLANGVYQVKVNNQIIRIIKF